MRTRLALACLAALLAGCGDSPAEPPAGLHAVLLTEPTSSAGEIAPTVQVTDDGAIVATVVGALSGCNDYQATAGRVRDIVLVTLTVSPNGGRCAGFDLPATFRIEVRPVPRGATEARFQRRFLDLDGGMRFQEALVRYDLHLR